MTRYCAKLGCRTDAETTIRLDDGRERPVCDEHAGDGEVIA